jgi:hypothetical protein
MVAVADGAPQANTALAAPEYAAGTLWEMTSWVSIRGPG